MTTLKEQVPKPLRTPVGLLSYIVGIVGATVGWVLATLGVTLLLELQGLGDSITTMESVTVIVTGVVVAVIGYYGLRGYMYFSY